MVKMMVLLMLFVCRVLEICFVVAGKKVVRLAADATDCGGVVVDVTCDDRAGEAISFEHGISRVSPLSQVCSLVE
jgi:hypothetical protein